jgi:ribosomal protein S15P/S13E
MKEKIEEIINKYQIHTSIGIKETIDVCDEWDMKTMGVAINELSTLIQEERKDAVEGLLNKCCKECRDLVYSEYALQEQDKKTNGVEKMVREEQGK